MGEFGKFPSPPFWSVLFVKFYSNSDYQMYTQYSFFHPTKLCCFPHHHHPTIFMSLPTPVFSFVKDALFGEDLVQVKNSPQFQRLIHPVGGTLRFFCFVGWRKKKKITVPQAQSSNRWSKFPNFLKNCINFQLFMLGGYGTILFGN